MKAFFESWLKSFDSRRFKALSLLYVKGVLVLVFLATAGKWGISISEENIVKVMEYLITALGGGTSAYLLGQSFSDAKTGGMTSQAAGTAFRQGFAEGAQTVAAGQTTSTTDPT
jgi:hypothetical protein